MTPVLGEFYAQSDFVIEIINKKDERYISYLERGGVTKNGEVIYIYHKPDHIKNKIGNFQSVKDFKKVWEKRENPQ